MNRIIFLIVFITGVALASSCDDKLFNLKAMSKSHHAITVKDILADLSMECDISVLFQDEKSKEVINKKLDFINIKDYAFEEFLDFLLAQNNLFYNYDSKKNLLKIAYYKTKNFDIDYINLTSMVSESKKSIVLGASGAGGSTGAGVSNIGGTDTGGNSGEANDYTTITTKSEFTFWDSLQKQLETLLSGVTEERDYKIFINKDASIVSVTGTKKELEAVEQFLQRLKSRMHKQVLIEAKLIEVIYNHSQTKGIDWSKFNLTLEGSRDAYKLRQDGVSMSNLGVPNYFFGYNFSIQGLFDFLKQYGDVKILSNPKILTLNNQPAIINVGDQLSYRYETSGSTNIGNTGGAVGTATFAIGQSFVGITLYVIPEITEDNSIIMKINPVTSELTNTNDTNSSASNINRTLPPDMKIKQLTSIVKVKDGQKILIGGLISKRFVNNNNKVPLLGDLPILGRLFHSTKRDVQKSELFILIIPKIITEKNMPTIDELKIFGEE